MRFPPRSTPSFPTSEERDAPDYLWARLSQRCRLSAPDARGNGGNGLHVFTQVPGEPHERCACGAERAQYILCAHCGRRFQYAHEFQSATSFAPSYLTIPGQYGVFYTGCLECWLARAALYTHRDYIMARLERRMPKTLERLVRRLSGGTRDRQ